MSLNKSKLSELVNILTMVLPLVRWWWWCCCLFLHQWMMVRWSTMPVAAVAVAAVVVAVAVAAAAADDEDGVQDEWTAQ